jgi:hypothetical protein
VNVKRKFGELNIVNKEKDVLSMEFIGFESKHEVDYENPWSKCFKFN